MFQDYRHEKKEKERLEWYSKNVRSYNDFAMHWGSSINNTPDEIDRVSCINKRHSSHTHIFSSLRPLSRRLDRCDRMIQNESRDPNGGNVRLFSAVT